MDTIGTSDESLNSPVETGAGSVIAELRMREQVQELALPVERLQGQFIALPQREQSEREKLYLRLQLEQEDQKRLTDKSEE